MRRGIGALAVVLMFGAIASVMVISWNALWRGSSRTLFSVQEHRQLVQLARSSLAEAYFRLQRALDEQKPLKPGAEAPGGPDAFEWCVGADAPAPARVRPEEAARAASMINPDALFNPAALRYGVADVEITRLRACPAADDGTIGVLDMKVVVTVDRATPGHHARLAMVHRHTFRLADDVGPHAGAGRHVDVCPTPSATVIDAD